MSNHEFSGDTSSVSDALARLAERIDGNDRRYEERWRSDQQALKDALAAAEKAVGAALTAAEKAVEKAETATTSRFESVNEFRGQLGDQARLLMPRAEFETQHSTVTREIAELRDQLSELRQSVAVGSPDVRSLLLGSAAGSGERASNRNAQRLLFSIGGLFLTLLVAIAVLALVLTHDATTTFCQVGTKLVAC